MLMYKSVLDIAESRFGVEFLQISLSFSFSC